MSVYEWLILDLDDTLLDYRRGSKNALSKCFAQFEIEFDPLHYQSFRKIDDSLWSEVQAGAISPGKAVTQRFEQLGTELGVCIDGDQWWNCFATHLVDDVFLIDHAEEALNQLSGFCKLAVATNGLSSIQRSRVSTAGLDHFFARVVVSEDVGNNKPGTDFFRHLHAVLDEPESHKV